MLVICTRGTFDPRASMLAILRRAYATAPRDLLHPRHADFRKALPKSLDHFIQRQKALNLWRDILRATTKIKDEQTRAEMKAFARAEFERNRQMDDLTHIRYLISTGREQFSSMRRYVDEMH